MASTDIAPPVLGVLESALYADDLTAATRFWQDVMGLTPFASAPDRHVFFRVADGPVPQILLIFRAEATILPGPKSQIPPHGTTGPGHFCLAVAKEALDTWVTHLLAKGVAIEADLTWPSGARSVYFRDPAGNSIELANPAIWPRLS